jgi:DNA-binding NtrC family response regulator
MPFIPVNCGAIPENLFENELFGHVKGAFTDANYHQVGLVQAANNGTLFLDEIDAISTHIQVKLLRLLENYEYKPLGDHQSHRANIRIIAATNRSLKKMVRIGSFREDLFYRLKIVHMHIPPLVERKEDIPLLAEYFFNKYIREYDKKKMRLTNETVSYLVSYPWRGNIRELENMIQHLIIMSKSNVLEVNRDQIDEEAGADLEPFKTAKIKAINSFEINYLTRILTEQKGDVAKAALKAEKGRTALWNLIKKHNIDPKTFRS